MGILGAVDRAALAAYCQCWGRWVDAEQNIRKHGAVVKGPHGFPVQNPYLTIAEKAIDQMRKLLVEFGMTPSSRSRINVAKPQTADNVFEKFAAELRASGPGSGFN